ncbi:helix-turn-helix transcriptional regulator [Novosphingopyxis sp. YJ-S2-01]|uniref:helix-turn-helix transcriptional regulator n=1 Tax=Novosphingopyxis sp. YJ-S2-01 TaxID=2794021 RepID=UPI0018DCBF75|nr:AlpA family phage regulatory protein [Novosphingopyxis sp. YJ-S2-01]MBH9537925.1 AlpA family phage regulatory protein [Novosphingopyxis sp. YJ-S2-01]
MVQRQFLQRVADDPLLTRLQVEAETGLSKTTLYRKMEEGSFPRPRRIGPNSVRWPLSTIRDWKADQPQT